MKTISPSRKCLISCGCGSFTFTIRSDWSNTSSAVSTSVAPTAAYASSANPLPLPASRWIRTWCPARTSTSAPTGIIATRYSSALTSFGTPTRTALPVWTDRFATRPTYPVRMAKTSAGLLLYRTP